MPNYLCETCGVQFAASEAPPDACLICLDERQYVGINGQHWTTLEEIQKRHRNTFAPLENGLTSIVTEPGFAIGQRAHLIQTPNGNVLWDCISLIDSATVSEIRARGGLSAIALSHPHYYSAIVEWSKAFEGIPIYIHAADKQWVTRPDPAIRFWEGESLSLMDGLTLVRCGGHFEGSTVLHWRDGADGRGDLFTGDTISVVTDRRYVSFMYSYPNLIPLPASAIKRIVDSVEPLAFDRIYDAFGRIVNKDAKASVRCSAERYLKAITGT